MGGLVVVVEVFESVRKMVTSAKKHHFGTFGCFWGLLGPFRQGVLVCLGTFGDFLGHKFASHKAGARLVVLVVVGRRAKLRCASCSILKDYFCSKVLIIGFFVYTHAV